MFSWDFLINGFFFFDIINLDFIKNIYTETNISFVNTLLDGLISSLMLGIKSCLLIFVFIWARASLPRIRFDQLMSYCWTVLLPIVIAFIILVPCVVYSLSLIPTNFYLI